MRRHACPIRRYGRKEFHMMIRIRRVGAPTKLALAKLRRHERRLRLHEPQLDRPMALEQQQILAPAMKVLQHLPNGQASRPHGGDRLERAPHRRLSRLDLEAGGVLKEAGCVAVPFDRPKGGRDA
jgi:hypothetical protein